MNWRKLASYPGNFLARWWMERMTTFDQKYILLRIYYLLLWHWLYYWTDYFQTFAFLHSSISKHVSMDAIVSEVTGLIFTFDVSIFFLIPPPYCASQNSSFLVKAFRSSLLSCFHHRNVSSHSPLTPFLTEAFCFSILLTYFLISLTFLIQFSRVLPSVSFLITCWSLSVKISDTNKKNTL